MLHLTPEQALGTKFEVWLEKLFEDLDYFSVRRNIIYHRSRYLFRQVDIEYHDINLWNTKVMVEAKYSHHGTVKLHLREPKFKAGQLITPIEDILTETEERRRFVDARKAILVTNRYFDDAVHYAAERFPKIELYQLSELQRLNQEAQGIFDFSERKRGIEEQINAVELSRCCLEARRVYL